MRPAESEVLARVAVMFAEAELVTAVVATENVAVVAPAGTVTDAGTVATLLEDAIVMTVPPVGAGPLSVKVPVEFKPPTKVVGFSVNTLRAAGLIVKVFERFADARLAEMLAFTTDATAVVVAVNVAEVAPAGMTTVAGTTALDDPEVKLTVSPPVGAGPSSVTVPVLFVPPVTVAGDKLSPVNTPGLTVNVPFAGLPAMVAVKVTVVTDATGVVAAVNVAVVAPAATVTVEGTVVQALSEVSVTVDPPDGAGPFRVTVPVDDVPPVTVVGESVTDDGTGAVTVRLAVADEPDVAVIVAERSALTGVVDIVKVVVVAPAATRTLAGTVTLELFEPRLTVSPPVGAGPFSVTVPVEELPPTIEVGFNVTDLGVGEFIIKVPLTVGVVPTVAETDT